MNPGSSTGSYPAFAHIGLRENPGKNLNQVTCPDRESNPGHLVSRPDALTVTPQVILRRFIKSLGYLASEKDGDNAGEMSLWSSTESYPAFGLRENPGKNLNQYMGPVPTQHRDALTTGSENPVSQTSYNGWEDHRANHTIPPFWLDDGPPLLRHVDVRPAAGWLALALHGL
ncbi:hypothetical protein ANN_16281 [Periplaneta americana]|uniref:Uncharacterized protein n=1 Tax=Periplaneta americana TaxID=6978 RepID=A0ABQ8SIN0_PERAM|nr:hypothetical protein ANN_16281 [Periplaneta americana]